jgi:hypothetical protein
VVYDYFINLINSYIDNEQKNNCFRHKRTFNRKNGIIHSKTIKTETKISCCKMWKNIYSTSNHRNKLKFMDFLIKRMSSNPKKDPINN